MDQWVCFVSVFEQAPVMPLYGKTLALGYILQTLQGGEGLVPPFSQTPKTPSPMDTHQNPDTDPHKCIHGLHHSSNIFGTTAGIYVQEEAMPCGRCLNSEAKAPHSG